LIEPPLVIAGDFNQAFHYCKQLVDAGVLFFTLMRQVLDRQ